MVEIIEKIRKEQRITKADLCVAVGVSRRTYYNAINAGTIDTRTASKMLEHMGYELAIIQRYKSV